MLSDLCQLFHGIKLLTNVRPIKFHFHKTVNAKTNLLIIDNSIMKGN